MGLAAAALVALSFQTGLADSVSPYADSATAELVRLGRLRHAAQDSAVRDYRAKLRYRISFSLGNRRWARVPLAAVTEKDAVVAWQLPNDVRVDVLGERTRAREEDWKIDAILDHPSFFPRDVGDSISFFGNELPEQAALHPLAESGAAWYRYALSDSVTIYLPDGTEVRLGKVTVVPSRKGPALIAGAMWLDRATGQVVRLTFRFVGTGLWEVPSAPEDSASARRTNALINRILTLDADLEYSLQDGQYWMPFRQILLGKVQVPLVTNIVVPFEASVTFDDYEINTGRAIVFTRSDEGPPAPDQPRWRRDQHARHRWYDDTTRAVDYTGRWAGGRYQIHRPAKDSLQAYDAWGTPLTLDVDPNDDKRIRGVTADLARLADRLDHDLTGRRVLGISYERAADILRFNRVQGLSAGLGYMVVVPGMGFTRATGTLRYGLGDGRVNVRAAVVRDAPGGQWRLSGYREVREVDGFFRVKSLGNAVNAVLTSHDNADYYVATGAALGYVTSLRRGLELTLEGSVERAHSAGRSVGAGLNGLWGDSEFQPNPPVTEGTFGVGGVRLDGVAGRASWSAAADVFVGPGPATGRIMARWRQPFPRPTGLTLTAQGGVATTPAYQQALFRLGGLPTLRGYGYGAVRGAAFWSAQADWAPFGGDIRPVAFLDAGQAGPTDGVFRERIRVGGGVGLSFFAGLMRWELSAPFRGADGNLRFDIVFGAVR